MKALKIFINKIKKWYFTKKWREDLIWCPSQITRWAFYDDKIFSFYLRWRWDDPWTASVIYYCGGLKVTVDISDTRFEFPFFKDDQYKMLEKWIDANEEKILKRVCRYLKMNTSLIEEAKEAKEEDIWL